jgi:hypothetical protein
MRLKKAVKSAIRGLVRSNAKDRPIAAWDRSPHWSEIQPESARSRVEYPALVGNSSTFTLIVAFMPESVATTVVCAYGVGNRLLGGLEGLDRRYLSPT